MFIDQLSSGAADLNIPVLQETIDNYTGIRFVFDFWFVSDFFIISNIVLLLWLGIFLSANLQIQNENGFGNLIVTRSGYKSYLYSIILSQTLYIFAVIAISTGLMVLIALFMGGVSFHFVQIGEYRLNLVGAIATIVVQVILMSVYASLINAICLVSNLWIRNIYVIQALPIVGFALLPLLLGSTIGNLSQIFARIIIRYLPQELFNSLQIMFDVHFQLSEIILCLIPLITYVILFALLYRFNAEKFSENYL
jgi:hypothetical protein